MLQCLSKVEVERALSKDKAKHLTQLKQNIQKQWQLIFNSGSFLQQSLSE
jgi:hypothetical protein